MEYQLGDIIKEKRIELGYTQQQLADLSGYTRTLISKIEQSKRNPSEELLLDLSYLLSFDFISLYKNQDKFKSLKHYILYNQLSQAIEQRNIQKVSDLLDNKIIKDEFNYGDTYILREYCNSLIYLEVDKNPKKAYKLCLKVLNIKEDSLDNHIIKLNQPHYYYSFYLSFERILADQGKLNCEVYLIKNIIKFLERNYFNTIIPLASVDYYFKKLYIICLNNLADVNLRLKNYDTALLICDTAIEKSKELNVLNILYDILILKIELLYLLGKKDMSIVSYTQLSSFCELTNHKDFLTRETTRIKEQYPDFLN